jgi:hypothetical protein
MNDMRFQCITLDPHFVGLVHQAPGARPRGIYSDLEADQVYNMYGDGLCAPPGAMAGCLPSEGADCNGGVARNQDRAICMAIHHTTM